MTIIVTFLIYFSEALQSTLELGHLVFEFSRSHTLRYTNTHAHTQTHTPDRVPLNE